MNDRMQRVTQFDSAMVVPDTATKPTIQLAAIAAFVVVNLFAPFFVGDVFPYTTSPMFRDEPKHYSIYKVYDEDGRPLRPENYGLQLNYNGNPPGLGAGIMPRITINEFGKIRDVAQEEAQVRETVGKLLQLTTREAVIVERQVVGPVDDQRVGLIEAQTRRWRIESEPKLDEIMRN